MPIDAKVKIFDEEYNLRLNSEDGKERLDEVAGYVDAKMREVTSNYINLSPKNIAVLAALNITEELFFLRDNQQGMNYPAPNLLSEERIVLLKNRINDILKTNL